MSNEHDLMTPDDETVVPTRQLPSRRMFFGAAGAIGIGAFVAACGGDDDDPAVTDDTTDDTDDTTGDEPAVDEAALVTFAAGLELLAVNTYKAGLDAATSGALGAVPPAVAEFATTAMAHHQAAADALAAAAGGITPVPPADVESAVNAEFAKVTDVTGLARLALDLETKAAATYLEVIPLLTSPDAIGLAGSILPIERQHAAVLLFVLGEYPVPDTFAGTDESLVPA